MSLIFYRTLFFCLVPVGIFILVKTIRMLKGVFNGELLAEIPFTQKEVSFEIPRTGVYAIWQKGQLFRRTPVDKFRSEIKGISSGELISLERSFFSPQLNGMDSGRMELFRFSADSGSYRLSLVEGSSISVIEQAIGSVIPAKEVDQTKYFIQVRESRPVYYMIGAIPLFILSGFCIFGGLVAGFLAPVILEQMGIIFKV